MIIKHRFDGKDGEPRTLAIELSDIDGKVKGIVFNGRAKDFREHLYNTKDFKLQISGLNMNTKCLRCGKDFKDENYEKLTEAKITGIAKRLWCNACVDILWKEHKEKNGKKLL